MRMLEPMQAYLRSAQRSRQMMRIEKLVANFDQAQRRRLAFAMAREMKAASACDDPARYQSSRRDGAPDGLKLAAGRIGSSNAEVQVCGAALWLAIAYHETLGARDSASQGVHRRIIRISRELKEFLEPGSKREGAKAARYTAHLAARA